MKAMEKKLEKIEDCQYYLKKKAKKVETLDGRIDGIEKEMKKMKEKEEDNETNEGFDYQGMDYNWEKQEWYMAVYEGSSCETKEADKGTAKPYGTGVKHRLKQMALRKQAPKQAPKKAPKPRGRPRKATQPKKFTTPEQTKRIRSRSQWVSTPFTEANTDEIEGRKKKHITKA
ncbi:hypothetical protein Bca52824_086824 [Brassica carinata]|uniref:Uncharacterized protein n=1 Tax=Brassica carinata TaxID=52824 RepID=A0A8X7P8I4_BRACI|nr:hypothetical protein Bca52824_086824 [Brassica carinata]